MKRAIYYLIRLDDACPTMNKQRWERVENILDRYGIKPLVGIIPKNEDPELAIEGPDPSFWEKAHNWEKKGWTIALHGYNHVYVTNKGGINPVQMRSEFAGLSLQEQEEKIEKGLVIFREHNLDVNYFYAPSHTFDNNTLLALLKKSKIRRICDSFARFPYGKQNMVFYPQQFGRFRNIKIYGYWTFCFHPNMMIEKMLFDFEQFINNHHDRFISFNNIDIKAVNSMSIIDRIISFFYFSYRIIKLQIKVNAVQHK